MSLLRLALAKFRALFRRNVVADEIRDEMQFHLEMREAEYRQQGLAPEDARRRAQKQFGNVAVMQDRGYDVRGGGMLETIWQDIRYSVRMLTKQRGFAAVTILTLALAMGASTALFSIIDAALLRPVPYPKPEEIVDIVMRVQWPDGQISEGMAPAAEDLDRWRTSGVLAHLGQGRVGGRRLIVDAGEPERLVASSISEDFLGVFGIAPILGRGIVLEDTRNGSPAVVLLGHDYWRRRFHRDADVIGRTLRVDGETATIVGILPPGFYQNTAVWQPMPEVDGTVRHLRGSGTPTYGRLRAGITLEQATETMSGLSLTTDVNQSVLGVRLRSLYDETVTGYRPAIRILTGAVVLVLLIGCINVSGLLLARGAAREGELAVRASMGAGRGRLIRQLLTESLVLAAAGGLGGILLAWLLLDGLVAILPLRLPENAPAAVNLQVLTFGSFLSFVTALVFGLVPAIRLSGAQIGAQLARVGRRHGSPLTKRGGQLLIAVEVALALVLLTGAGLMVRSFSQVLSIDVGFDPDSFVTMEVFPTDTSATVKSQYFPALLQAVRAIPGVTAAGAINFAPLSRGAMYTTAYAPGSKVSAAVKEVMPGYFEAIGLAPLQGRLPTETDYAQGTTAVLSEGAARQLFPDGAAVGGQFTTTGKKRVWNVIGVVSDIRSRDAFMFEEGSPDVYLSLRPDDAASWFAHFTGAAPTVIVRPSGRMPALAEDLRRAALSVGPPVIVERIRWGSDWFGDNVQQTRHRTLLLGLIGGLGLSLTLVGIIGVTAYAVARRTQEIGVRMAFGATPADVVGRILRDAAWPVIVGLAVGLSGAYYATRVIESFLYKTPPHDPATFVAVAIVMGLVALVAALIPARRAAMVDPVIALRAE